MLLFDPPDYEDDDPDPGPMTDTSYLLCRHGCGKITSYRPGETIAAEMHRDIHELFCTAPQEVPTT